MEMDCDEHCVNLTESEIDLVNIYRNFNHFARGNFERVKSRGSEGPMDVDSKEGSSDWLKMESNDEPCRKRHFSDRVEKTNAKDKDNAKDENVNEHKTIFGIGGPFLFSAPQAKTNESEKYEQEYIKPRVRSQDQKPISANVAKKVSKSRLEVLNQSSSFGETRARNKTKKKGISKEMEKMDLNYTSRSKSESVKDIEEVESSTTEDEPILNRVVRSGDKRSSKSVSRGLGLKNLQIHKDIPFVVAGYVQLFFNIFMAFAVVVIVLLLVKEIGGDIERKVQEYSVEIVQEISKCTKDYIMNQCDPLTRVPAMENECLRWEACMNQDPKVVARARISAETIAEIINSFIEPISIKTMVFFLMLFFGTLYISNSAFSTYRRRRAQNHQSDVPFPNASPGEYFFSKPSGSFAHDSLHSSYARALSTNWPDEHPPSFERQLKEKNAFLAY
ncbi:Nucleus export protein brr6 [Zancudomyces culisetae]|uniref:Nucleus export protein brr6 n=1 Tax=Zancudomyces culisetae TaxID=1213189 RepID=A0A1R1PP57_ZANCU|nr:Nucleus export protein brr6 [Zancudomyces culisetae]|eukprot:OMH82766.1 Nucleus export protein brr6 [Zancudomyces culisetae]